MHRPGFCKPTHHSINADRLVIVCYGMLKLLELKYASPGCDMQLQHSERVGLLVIISDG